MGQWVAKKTKTVVTPTSLCPGCRSTPSTSTIGGNEIGSTGGNASIDAAGSVSLGPPGFAAPGTSPSKFFVDRSGVRTRQANHTHTTSDVTRPTVTSELRLEDRLRGKRLSCPMR